MRANAGPAQGSLGRLNDKRSKFRGAARILTARRSRSRVKIFGLFASSCQPPLSLFRLSLSDAHLLMV